MSKINKIMNELFSISEESKRYMEIANEIQRQLKAGGAFNSAFSFYGMNSLVAGKDDAKTPEQMKDFEGTEWAKDKFMTKGNLGFLRFKASGSKIKRGGMVKIALNGKDLYDMTFMVLRGNDFKIVKQFEDVYAEDLDDRLKDVLG